MPNEAISPENLSPPIGAYSHAIRAGKLLFVSGQTALDADGNVIAVGDMEAQARVAFENLGRVLAAAGAGPQHVTALTIFLTDMSRRAEVAKVRREFVVDPYPASTLVGVSELALPDLLVEVDAIAVLDDEG